MQTETLYRDKMMQELSAARQSAVEGNLGKSRVCARRAVGCALRWFLEYYPDRNWGLDVISQLTSLKNDTTFPQDIREAASRLTTKISDQFAYPFSQDPIEDARHIISHIVSMLNEHHDGRV